MLTLERIWMRCLVALSLCLALSAGAAERTTYYIPDARGSPVAAPERIRSVADLPGNAPKVARTLTPPAGTPIQRGVVPGGEYGGSGGAAEVIFPEGFWP